MQEQTTLSQIQIIHFRSTVCQGWPNKILFSLGVLDIINWMDSEHDTLHQHKHVPESKMSRVRPHGQGEGGKLFVKFFSILAPSSHPCWNILARWGWVIMDNYYLTPQSPRPAPNPAVKYDIVHMHDQAFSKQPLNEFGSWPKNDP